MGVISIRVPEPVEAELEAAVEHSGQSVSEFVLAALAEKLERCRAERLAALSRKLSARGLEENAALDGTLADGLVR